MALNFTTPIGRIVGGDPHNMTQNIDDKTKQPKVRQDGAPMLSSYMAIAIPKNDPEWPAFDAMCKNEAKRLWPDGRWEHPAFSTKIEDGDSTTLNKKMKRNCDREGYPGHWIVKVGSGYAPTVNVWLTAAQATEQGRVPPGKQAIDGWYASPGGEVNSGDYVRVAGTIDTNKRDDSPGMYMNYNQCALQRKGVPIVVGVDANEAFGSAPPPGAAGGVAPAPAPTPAAATTAYTGYMDPKTDAPLPPASDAPPPPSAAGPTMTAKAGATTFEQFKAKGWTLQQLIANGYVIDDGVLY